jgi:branched-chain amino acid aminotransferase
VNVTYSKGKKVPDQILLQRFDAEAVGIFESLRTYKGRIFHVDEHLDRFQDSARTAGTEKIPNKVLKAELESALAAFKKEHPAAAREDLFIRLAWWPFGAPGGSLLTVTITHRKHPADLYKNGVILRTSNVRRSLSHAAPPQAKTSAYQNALLATLEPSPGYEWVFLDQAGFVTEVRIGNLFIVKKNRLLTPPTTGILNGVTRRFVIESAHQAGVEVKETPLTRHEIYNADEAFLTNTSWEILPVRELDGRSTGRKIPGPVTRKLHKIFKKKAAACL